MRLTLACAALISAGAAVIMLQGAADFSPIAFEDVATRAGVRFVLQNSATPEKHQIEAMVSGVAVFDFNNDGKPDLYFVNGAAQPELAKSDPSYYNRLYRNNGDGTFTDVTLSAGVRGEGFATGV